MRLIIFYCLFVFSCSSGQEYKKLVEGWDSYLTNFKTKELPLKLDRRATFQLSKANNSIDTFAIVRKDFLSYIPKEIIDNQQTKNLRCIYILPKRDDLISVIIARDFYYDDEQRKLELILITYSNKGIILDFKEIAGYDIDITERFAEITNDFEIKSDTYQFKMHPDNNHLDLAFLVETKRIYKINNGGEIINVSEAITEGYFEGDWVGYTYVRSKD